MRQYAREVWGEKETDTWHIYIPAPEVKRWRITGVEVDGKQGIEVVIKMSCDELEHSPLRNHCRMCGKRHEPPKATDQRYAYRWYPMLPSVRSIMQWKRRNFERGLDFEYY